MSKPQILLIGAGGHANACIDVIEQQDRYRIAGLVGAPAELHARRLGYSVIATDADLPKLAAEFEYALVAVGQIRSPETRMRLYRQAVELGFQLPVIIAPTAYVSRHAMIGSGSIVMHGAIVNAQARVGVNCIVNTRALLEHDVMIGDHCHISTGAILNGNVSVGAGSFVGSGSILKEGVTLGTGCVIGMGLAVRHSQADRTRYTGNDKP